MIGLRQFDICKLQQSHGWKRHKCTLGELQTSHHKKVPASVDTYPLENTTVSVDLQYVDV